MHNSSFRVKLPFVILVIKLNLKALNAIYGLNNILVTGPSSVGIRKVSWDILFFKDQRFENTVGVLKRERLVSIRNTAKTLAASRENRSIDIDAYQRNVIGCSALNRSERALLSGCLSRAMHFHRGRG